MFLKNWTARCKNIYSYRKNLQCLAKPYAEYLDLGGVVISYNGAKVVEYKSDRVVFELPLQERKYVRGYKSLEE